MNQVNNSITTTNSNTRKQFFTKTPLPQQKRNGGVSVGAQDYTSHAQNIESILDEKIEIYIPSRLRSKPDNGQNSSINGPPLGSPNQNNPAVNFPFTTSGSGGAGSNSIGKQTIVSINNNHNSISPLNNYSSNSKPSNTGQNKYNYLSNNPRLNNGGGGGINNSSNSNNHSNHLNIYTNTNQLSKYLNEMGSPPDTTNSSSLKQVTTINNTGPSSFSNRQPTPERKAYNSQNRQVDSSSSSNYPNYLKEFNFDYQNESNGILKQKIFQQNQTTSIQPSSNSGAPYLPPTSNKKENNNAFLNLKRQMRFNMLKNVYDTRNIHSNYNHPSTATNSHNSSNHNYLEGGGLANLLNTGPGVLSNNSNGISNTNNLNNITNQLGSINNQPPKSSSNHRQYQNQTPSNQQNSSSSNREREYSNRKKLNQSFNEKPQNRVDSGLDYSEQKNPNSLSILDKSNAFQLTKLLARDRESSGENYNDSNNALQKGEKTIYKAVTVNTGLLRDQNQNSLNNSILEKGKKLFKENDLDKAESCFQEVLDSDEHVIQCHYLLGVCYLSKNQFDQAIKEFCTVIDRHPTFKQNIYLLASIAYKKTQNFEAAISILTQAIQQYPNYYDAYIYRAQLYNKDKQYDRALNDFDISIKISPDQGLGYLGQADSLRLMNQFEQAIQYYTKALLTDQSIRHSVLIKRSICLYEINDFEKGILDITDLINQDPSNSEAYYYQGLFLLKDKTTKGDALLSFEQSIKFNNNLKAVTQSIYELTKIKIEQRDFYQAFHTLSRSQFLQIDKKFLEKFRLFTEGVIFLMKRQFRQAIDNFNTLQQNHSNLGQFLKPLFYVYRAYGYFCLGKHQNALYDYLSVESEIQEREDKNSIYNKYLCEGIINVCSSNQNLEQGLLFFSKASKIFKNQIEPLFYRGVSINHLAFKTFMNKDSDQLVAGTHEALQEIDAAIEVSDNNANLFFFRALLRMFHGFYADGINDIDKAIQKSEDNVPQYFYLRGHAFACCRSYQQAINDLTIAINLDENYAAAYLQRSQSYLYSNDHNTAFVDLQQYISLKPDDPNNHLYAGNLLFISRSYDDAIKAYSHADDINKKFQLLVQRAKCFLIQRNLGSALKDVVSIVQLQTNKQATLDKLCIGAIKTAIEDQKYEQGASQILKAVSFDISQGYLFQKWDLLVYAGAMRFYEEQYELAIDLFLSAMEEREKYVEEKRNREASKEFSEINLSEEFNDESGIKVIYDSSDTCSKHDLAFNIAMSYIMMSNFKEAYDTCLQFSDSNLSDSTHNRLNSLIQILHCQIEEKAEINTNERNIYQELFNVDGKLSELFPKVQPPFDCFSKKIELNLVFDIPKLDPPNIQPTFEIALLEKFEVTDIENKPEAPWIRRNDQGIIFTDNIQFVESLDLDTEQQTEKGNKGQQAIDYDDTDNDQSQEEQISNVIELDQDKEQMDFKKLKQNLKLDNSVQKKLQMILEKKQKNQQKIQQATESKNK